MAGWKGRAFFSRRSAKGREPPPWWSATRKTAPGEERFYYCLATPSISPHPGTATDAKRALRPAGPQFTAAGFGTQMGSETPAWPQPRAGVSPPICLIQTESTSCSMQDFKRLLILKLHCQLFGEIHDSFLIPPISGLLPTVNQKLIQSMKYSRIPGKQAS